MLALPRLLCVGLLFIVGFPAPVVQADDRIDIRQSVVQISTTARMPNVFQPWLKQPATMTGSGAIISGNRILTNAHVVAFASQIYVQGFQSAEKVGAKVLFSAPNIDLAVLEIEDPEFFAKRPAIEISKDLPRSGQSVSVYGFPVGGTELSTTEGVISRIEYAPFSAGTSALRIQVDAAINPGNSGGPAIVEGKMIGVAFSKAKQAENIGYLIAAEEVLAFLDDIQDGQYTGRAQWLHTYQPLDNASLRAYYKLSKETGGVLLTHIHGVNPDTIPIKLGDIVTHIENVSIDSEGKVNVGDSLRVPFHYHVPRMAKDGHIGLTILRDGDTQKVSLPVGTQPSLVVPIRGNKYPRYFIYGPLSFSTASNELIESLPPQILMALVIRRSPFLLRRTDVPAAENEELVVIPSNPFASNLMKGYNPPTLATLTSINGARVENLAHAAQLIRQCQDEFIRFDFADAGLGALVFRRSEMDSATEAILQDNGIRSDCSDDLKAIWAR